MNGLMQDIRFALRGLRKSPGFTVIALLCLGLGIGLNITIFSTVSGVLINPFGFADEDRLVFLQDSNRAQGADGVSSSYANIQDLRAHNSSFADVAPQGWVSLTITEGEEPERFAGAAVSANLFPMLGVRPVLGRLFHDDEDRVGAPDVVLLSHEVWRRRFGGNPTVVGRTVMINRKPYTVVGVMPPRFAFPVQHKLWVPLAPVMKDMPRGARNVSAYAKLKPNVDLRQARAELKTFSRALAERFPAENRGWEITARRLRDQFVPDEVRLILLTMLGAVWCVLLIAASNVANLMLARASVRQREVAVRCALGAGRGRIMRQLLTESVILGFIGATIGVLLAFWGTDLLRTAVLANQVPYYVNWSIDGRTLVYTVLVALVTGLLFGLAPALQASRENLVDALKEGGRTPGAGGAHSRTRSALVVVQLALSVVLLIGASLFVRSFIHLRNASGGIDASPIMTLRFYMPGDDYGSPGPLTRRVEDVLSRIEVLPGVDAATASNTMPLLTGGAIGGIAIEGRSVAVGEEPRIFYTGVSSHWFRTLGVRLVRGRDFTDAEGRDSSGVSVIDQAMARRFWPSDDAVGKRFRLMSDSTHRWITVIGVSPQVAYGGLDSRDPLPAAYLPYPYLAARNTALLIRVTGPPASIAAAARRAIRAADPGLAVFQVSTLETVRRSAFWQYGIYTWLFSIFGAMALLLATIGVYGVVSYMVAQRTHEIGVRVALGASRGDVLQLVLSQGVRLALVGVVLGVVGAWAAAPVVRSLLWGATATDPLSFTGIPVLLAGVTLLASYLPARRALGVDPVVALRYE